MNIFVNQLYSQAKNGIPCVQLMQATIVFLPFFSFAPSYAFLYVAYGKKSIHFSREAT